MRERGVKDNSVEAVALRSLHVSRKETKYQEYNCPRCKQAYHVDYMDMRDHSIVDCWEAHLNEMHPADPKA